MKSCSFSVIKGTHFKTNMPARQKNLEFEDADQEQLDRLESGETNAAEVLNVNNLRRSILGKIRGAAEEGVISRTDAEKLTANLRDTHKSEADVWRVGSEVSQVISESKQLIDRFTGDEPDPKELDMFRDMSLMEKREYVGALIKKADSLTRRAERLEDLLPEEERRLSSLKGVERAKFVEELTERRANVAQYGGMLKGCERHFSPASAERYKAEFRELSVGEQKSWIKLFGETQVKPREILSARFDALPVEYQARAGKFFDLSRHEKEALVQKLEEERAFDKKVDDSSESRYVSKEARDYAKDSFRAAPAPLRREMTAMLEKHMKAEAELGMRFEKLSSEVQARYPGFVDMAFERKQRILKSLDKHEVLRSQYDEILSGALSEKIISMSTYKNRLKWFERKSLDEKRDIVSASDDDMKSRRKLKERFEKELPKDIRDLNAHFYELAGHERMELFERLKAESEKKIGVKAEVKESGVVLSRDQLNQMAAKARELAGQKKMELATSMYQTILVYDPLNAEAMGFLIAMAKKKEADVVTPGESKVAQNDDGIGDDRIRSSLNEVKRESGVRKLTKLINVAEGVADLANASDLNNRGEIRSDKKDGHLDGAEARGLNRQLLEHSGGKVKLGRRMEDKARKIQRVDITRLDKMEEGDVFSLKSTVVEHSGDSRMKADHIQLVRQDSGQELAGKSGLHAAERMKSNLRRRIATEAEARLRASGQVLSENDRAKMKEQLDADDMKVNLREAA